MMSFALNMMNFEGYPHSALYSEDLGSDLFACKWKCEQTPGCNYVNQGWEHAPTWCMLLEECMQPLNASLRGCGSSGANGVHTWQIERPPEEKKKKKSKSKKKKKNSTKKKAKKEL